MKKFLLLIPILFLVLAASIEVPIPYIFGTGRTISSGNIIEVMNNGTNKLWITFDGVIHAKSVTTDDVPNLYFEDPKDNSSVVAISSIFTNAIAGNTVIYTVPNDRYAKINVVGTQGTNASSISSSVIFKPASVSTNIFFSNTASTLSATASIINQTDNNNWMIYYPGDVISVTNATAGATLWVSGYSFLTNGNLKILRVFPGSGNITLYSVPTNKVARVLNGAEGGMFVGVSSGNVATHFSDFNSAGSTIAHTAWLGNSTDPLANHIRLIAAANRGHLSCNQISVPIFLDSNQTITVNSAATTVGQLFQLGVVEY